MLEGPFLLELVENIGFPSVIFIIWYLYHKAQVRNYEDLYKAQADREKYNFELL